MIDIIKDATDLDQITAYISGLLREGFTVGTADRRYSALKSQMRLNGYTSVKYGIHSYLGVIEYFDDEEDCAAKLVALETMSD